MLKSKSGLTFVIITLVLSCFSFIACGGGDGDNTDGDTEQTADGDDNNKEDGDIDEETADTHKEFYDGMWKLKDTNAFKWYNANDLTGFYFISDSSNEFVFFMVDSVGDSYCTRQEMTTSEGRMVPALDSGNCWYELSTDTMGNLIIQSRNRNDPDDISSAWYFSFSKVNKIDEYDYKQCNILDECVSYYIE